MGATYAQKLLEDYSSKLGEHFDSVQIMVSWTEGGLTKSLLRGSGNWYARQGMARAFINQDIAQENAIQIAEHLNPPDDSDNWKKGKP